jgi:hypothetical protein
MGKGRTIASIVALALLIGLLGACGGGSSKSSSSRAATRAAAQTRAARAKVLAAQRRLAAAQRRVVQQRLAFAAAVRRRRLEENRQATSTTTTTAPKTPPPAAPKPARPPQATPAATVSADAVAIQRSIDAVNAAFAKGVVAGIAASERANYYIGVGVYTGGECSAFEAARGEGVVADQLVVHVGSVVPTPHWVDPVLGAVPGGRVYALTMDDVQTQVLTKEQRTQIVTTHATVLPNGRALLFLRCS